MQTQCASQKTVNDYFESVAAYWKKVYSGDQLMPEIYRDRHNTALGWVRELRLPANARILEVGCGAGFITVALAKEGYTVDASDSTVAMLQMTWNHATDQGVHDRIRMHPA